MSKNETDGWGGGDHEDPGSSPVASSCESSAITKWQKITHMSEPSVTLHVLCYLRPEEHRGAAWAKQESHITPATSN